MCSRVTVRPPERVCGVESATCLTPEPQLDLLRLHAAAFLRRGAIIDHEPGQQPVTRLNPTAAGEPPPVGHLRTVSIPDRIILAVPARPGALLSLLRLRMYHEIHPSVQRTPASTGSQAGFHTGEHPFFDEQAVAHGAAPDCLLWRMARGCLLLFGLAAGGQPSREIDRRGIGAMPSGLFDVSTPRLHIFAPCGPTVCDDTPETSPYVHL